MAKTVGGLFALDAGGALGKAIVYSKWKGRNYVRRFIKPQNTQSDDQAKVRTILAVDAKIAKKIVRPSTLYTEISAVTPADNSWNAFFGKAINGFGNLDFDADHTAYGALDGTHKGYWTDGATDAGLSDFALPYGIYGTITKGEQLYHAAAAAFRLSLPSADGFSGAWAAVDVDGFVTAMTT
jgi:hypothetical protein